MPLRIAGNTGNEMIDQGLVRKYSGIEFAGTEKIRELQETMLRDHLRYLISHSPYYGMVLGDVEIDGLTLDKLPSLPFTDKNAIEECNDNFLAVPMSKIVDIVMSSGTTGKPTRIMYTEHDMKRLAYNEEISLAGCGVTHDDVVLLTCTMDRCFIAGLAYYSGARGLGAAVIRNGISSMASHREIIRQMRPTVIVGVPTLLLKLGLFLKAQNVDPRGVGVTRLVCIGEPIRDKELSLLKIGKYLEEIWGAAVFSTYASSETITSFCECISMQGGHLHPDLAIVEIINDDGAVLPFGEVGEVVVTPLAIEGMPLLRFKTGDVSFLIERPCTCGRNSLRLGPILGRKKQMIKCRGTTLYPNAIHSVLDGIGEISEYYLEVTNDFDLSDRVRIYVSLNDDSYSAERIMDKLQAHLRIRPEVEIVSEQSIRTEVYAENSRKLTRFKDRRKS